MRGGGEARMARRGPPPWRRKASMTGHCGRRRRGPAGLSGRRGPEVTGFVRSPKAGLSGGRRPLPPLGMRAAASGLRILLRHTLAPAVPKAASWDPGRGGHLAGRADWGPVAAAPPSAVSRPANRGREREAWPGGRGAQGAGLYGGASIGARVLRTGGGNTNATFTFPGLVRTRACCARRAPPRAGNGRGAARSRRCGRCGGGCLDACVPAESGAARGRHRLRRHGSVARTHARTHARIHTNTLTITQTQKHARTHARTNTCTHARAHTRVRSNAAITCQAQCSNRKPRVASVPRPRPRQCSESRPGCCATAASAAAAAAAAVRAVLCCCSPPLPPLLLPPPPLPHFRRRNCRRQRQIHCFC